jgi:hypothetical protein
MAFVKRLKNFLKSEGNRPSELSIDHFVRNLSRNNTCDIARAMVQSGSKGSCFLYKHIENFVM